MEENMRNTGCGLAARAKRNEVERQRNTPRAIAATILALQGLSLPGMKANGIYTHVEGPLGGLYLTDPVQLVGDLLDAAERGAEWDSVEVEWTARTDARGVVWVTIHRVVKRD